MQHCQLWHAGTEAFGSSLRLGRLGCFGFVGLSFGRGLAFGDLGDGVWVSSDEVSALNTVRSNPYYPLPELVDQVFYTKTELALGLGLR